MQQKDLVKEWELKDAPVLWIESIHSGDVEKLRQITGFSYSGHVFVSQKQRTTFYRNKLYADQARKFGNQNFGNAEFVEDFCNKTKETEKQLLELVKTLQTKQLENKTNDEVWQLFQKFFNLYSALIGFYRITRPEFYAELTEKLKAELPEPREENLSKALSGSEIKLSGEVKQLADNLRALGRRRFEMHETWTNTFRDAEPLFAEIARRLGISELEIRNCLSHEIKSGLLEQKKINKLEIDKRLNYFRFEYEEKSFTMSTQPTIFEESLQSNEIKGQIAHTGVARGKVSILREYLGGILAQKMDAMQKGNILVATNTSPDMMPAILKASAIITDEGGLLCHAAIVSRELGIPCIVGTKNSTQLLHNGDEVEVDANKGTVTRLNEKN